MFITSVQHLDKKLCNHTAVLLHVSAFVYYLQGDIRQKKTQHWLIVMDVQF
jgi:hypothetical protein